MIKQDFAAIEAGGAFLDAWTSYSFASDLFTPADSFRLSIAIGTTNSRVLRSDLDRLRAMMEPGKTVKLWIGSAGKRALQGIGVIDARELDNDADGGTSFVVEGRDLASHLISSAADPSLYASDDTLLSVARRVVAPWGIEVTADHVAGRDLRQARVTKGRLERLRSRARSLGIPPRMMSEKLAVSIDRGTISFEDFAQAAQLDIDGVNTYVGDTFVNMGVSSLQLYQLRVKDVRPQSGETRWEYLDRHAQRNGLLMQMDAQGRLVLCGLHYDQEPSYRLTRRIAGDRSANNILSGGARHDLSDAYSDVFVYGRAKGADETRSPYKGHAADSGVGALPFLRTLITHDNSIRNRQDAQARAEYVLAKSRQGAVALRYTVAGHSANGLVFATDTIAHVEDQVVGVNGPFYVTARTFARDTQLGPTTELKLVPPGSIVLKEAA